MDSKIDYRQDGYHKGFADGKRTGGKIALRRAQFKAATSGNNTALMIWLGKQYLEQTDQQNITADVKLNGFQVIADPDEDLSE